MKDHHHKYARMSVDKDIFPIPVSNSMPISMPIAILIPVLIMVLILPVFSPVVSFAEDMPLKHVRVAEAGSGIFMKMDENGQPFTGYAYEYIERIGAYSNWDVEYVHIPGFSECLKMLINGDVDVFFDVSYTPQRSTEMLFSNMPMGSEEYYLYCLSENDDIHVGDYLSMDHKRVGVTSGTAQISNLIQWCEDKEITLEVVEYSSVSEKAAALTNGEIDLSLEVSMMAESHFSAIEKISSSDYYLVTNLNRADLMNDINSAYIKILNIDQYYFTHLSEKYFSETVVSRTLTSEEKNWISTHDHLRVGCLSTYLPFSALDEDGSVTGLVTDIVPLMLENIRLGGNLEISYTAYHSDEELLDALNRGEIDAAFPVYGGVSYANKKKALFSTGVIGLSMDLAYKGTYSEKTTAKIAVNIDNQMQESYTKICYPDAQIVYFDSIEACLDAILKGNAGTTILNGMRTQLLISQEAYNTLKTLRLPESVEFCFAVKQGNAALLSLINRAIVNTEEAAAITYSYDYMNTSETYGAIDFLTDNMVWILLFLSVVVAIISILLLQKRKADVALARKENEQFQKLIDNFVATYNLSYLVKLSDESFILLRSEDSRVKTETGKTFDHFSEARDFYISHVVYSSDRDKMTHELAYATIRQRLRKENSYIVEFRGLVDGLILWHEMKISSVDGDNVAIGFTQRDTRICERHLQQSLNADYYAFFAVNLDNGLLKIIKQSPYDTNWIAGETLPYEEVILSIAERQTGEAKTFYRKLGDLSYVRKLFEAEDKFSYSYQSPYLEDMEWVSVTGRVIIRNEDRTPAAFALTFNIIDTLEQEKQELRIQLSDALEKADIANRSKTSFLFNMSHDIRTPMNAIMGFTSMAIKYIDDKSRVISYLSKINTSGQQLLLLINQVLEMARIESGKMEIHLSPVNIREEYTSSVTVLSEQAEENGLEFHPLLLDMKHPYVLADVPKMSSITLNITGNAMKYTPRGGRIDFMLRELPERKEGFATYTFTVQDTGIGMSEEYLKTLYEPFTREQTSTVSKIQGTGLGMTIVKETVNLLGGTIDVHSEPGKGTRFDITVDFPIDKEAHGAITAEQDIDLAALEGRKVLLVEDNELNREIASDILEDRGFELETAENGSIAVDLLREKGPDTYDFILMDIQMPVMNGYEATAAIRSMYPDRLISIIALSANAFSEDKAASIAAGMNDHVAKPINIQELLYAMSRCLQAKS